MTRTFIDAGVLIAAARGTHEVSEKAQEILDDPDREYASSFFVKLEVLPKSIYNKRKPEAEFYEAFFDAVSYWAEGLDTLADEAYSEACASGLSAVDSLHVAAAKSSGADELVTTEKTSMPIHRVTAIKVVSIHPK